jgi:hypothetical protein
MYGYAAHTYVHTYIHTYIHKYTYAHTFILTYTYINTYKPQANVAWIYEHGVEGFLKRDMKAAAEFYRLAG